MKYTVLYVDDEDINLRTFTSVFRRDYNVITAQNGEEGIALTKKHRPDLIITDQYMPGMNGWEFLEKVVEQQLQKTPSTIMLSAYAKAQEVDQAKKDRLLWQFVTKPWERNEMKKIMDEVIAANDT